MSYQLKVSDNNGTDIYGPFNTLAELSKERTQLISAYNYNSKHGFKRLTYDDKASCTGAVISMIVFKHAIYSSVVFQTEKVNQ